MSSMALASSGNGDSKHGSASQLESAAVDVVDGRSSGAPAIIYNSSNFQDHRIELQIRHIDGKIADLSHTSEEAPSGLRFPAAGVINNHFILGGTRKRAGSHEYLMWALNLSTLVWHRIRFSSGLLEQGSWNRGVSWPKRNTFVILGDRSRDFDKDYFQRRVNFANFATVELEAFGLYDMASDVGPSCTSATPHPLNDVSAINSLGTAVMGSREFCDMEILSIDGKRLPVNSYLLAQRWGSYFENLMARDLSPGDDSMGDGNLDGAESTRSRLSDETIGPGSRSSVATTIFPSSRTSVATIIATSSAAKTASSLGSDPTSLKSMSASALSLDAPLMRSRVLFLPHTYFTVRALVYYLYTFSLPPLESPLCTAQILCSLLQITRAYRVDGLLEATVGRLHQILDGRNTAAIFNAVALAAGGGNSVAPVAELLEYMGVSARTSTTNVEQPNRFPCATSSPQSASATEPEPEDDQDEIDSVDSSLYSLADSRMNEHIWAGDYSAVMGLQKRALRALLEGRKLRDRMPQENSRSSAQSPMVGTNP